METNEMTTGVAMNVNTASTGRTNTSTIIAGESEASTRISLSFEGQKESSSSPVKGEFSEGNVQKEQDMADQLLASAKGDGLEQALINLAEGKFESDRQEDDKLDPETTDSLTEEPSSGVEKAVSEGEILEPIDSELFLDERALLTNRIRNKEGEIDAFLEKKKDEIDKIKNAESGQPIDEIALMEQFFIWSEMLKNTEDSEKKLSMLDLILNFLKVMFVPGEEEILEDGLGDQNEKHEEQQGRSMEDVVRILHENRKIPPQKVMQRKAPIQEYQQAA